MTRLLRPAWTALLLVLALALPARGLAVGMPHGDGGGSAAPDCAHVLADDATAGGNAATASQGGAAADSDEGGGDAGLTHHSHQDNGASPHAPACPQADGCAACSACASCCGCTATLPIAGAPAAPRCAAAGWTPTATRRIGAFVTDAPLRPPRRRG